ncbi:MAG TPA: hypothetical protein VGW38_10570, partial [Chloroflexota bacterium]|nr:hypothetical protein [Chloroflexota bacterium]
MISLRLNGTFVQSAPRRRSRRLRRREALFPLLSIAVTAVSVAALLTGFGLWALPAWTWHGILAWMAGGYLAAWF